jgi:hypothetical protein
MKFLERFRKPLPSVDVSDSIKDAIGLYCDALDTPPTPEKVASTTRSVIHDHLYPVSQAFRKAAPVHPDALEMYLMLCVWAGMAAQVAEEHGWTKALATAEPASVALREYVPYSRRFEWDKGPVPLVVYAQQQNKSDTDPVHATLGVMAQLLGLTQRTGGLEGFFRMGILCWMAGEVMGAKLEVLEPVPEDATQ